MFTGRKIYITGLKTAWLGKTAYFYESVPSTQDIARLGADETTPDGTLILAERQTKGRGRRGRTWTDIPGRQIFASLLLRPPGPPDRVALLNIVSGFAICDALEELGIGSVGLKWPNDVFVAGKKISGVLAETSLQSAGGPWLILGLGLNVEGADDQIPAEIRATATTVQCHREGLDRMGVLAGVLRFLETWIGRFSSGESAGIRSEFDRRSIFRGKEITADLGASKVCGIAEGIDDDGALFLRTSAGLKRITAAESLSA